MFQEDGMTQLLEQAIAKVKELPPAQQDAIATLILEELEDEALWDKKFGQSQNALAKLASEAMAEYRSAITEKVSPKSVLSDRPQTLPCTHKSLVKR
jgi:hypothetical protein